MKIFITAVLLLATTSALGAEMPIDRAAPAPVAPTAGEVHVPCWVIRSYVWAHGEAAAIAWAVRNGYTTSQITSIRARCIVH